MIGPILTFSCRGSCCYLSNSRPPLKHALNLIEAKVRCGITLTGRGFCGVDGDNRGSVAASARVHVSQYYLHAIVGIASRVSENMVHQIVTG